jgi:hypothetical protein
MKRSAASVPLPLNRLLLATLLLLAFAGSIGLAFVWLRHQISEVARANMQFQTRTVEVERRIAEANAQIAAAHNPQVLLRQNVELNLGLAAPRERQVVRVDDEVAVLLAAKRNSELYSFVPVSFSTTPR